MPRVFRRIARAAAPSTVSPKFVRVPTLTSTPESLARMRPHVAELGVASPVRATLARLRESGATIFGETRRLSLDIRWQESQVADDAEDGLVAAAVTRLASDYSGLVQLSALVSLRLAVNSRAHGVFRACHAVGDRLLSLTVGFPDEARIDPDHTFLTRCPALTALKLERAPLGDSHADSFRTLGKCAPALRSLHLGIGRESPASTTALDFLGNLTALRELVLDTSAASVEYVQWLTLPVMPLLERLDLARSRLTLDALGERGGRASSGDDEDAGAADGNEWTSLTSLVAPLHFDVDQLSCLPRSLTELDLGHCEAVMDTLLALSLPPLTTTPPPPVGLLRWPPPPPSLTLPAAPHGGRSVELLPDALRRVILRHNCSVIAASTHALLHDFLWLHARVAAFDVADVGSDRGTSLSPSPHRISIVFAPRCAAGTAV